MPNKFRTTIWKVWKDLPTHWLRSPIRNLNTALTFAVPLGLSTIVTFVLSVSSTRIGKRTNSQSKFKFKLTRDCSNFPTSCWLGVPEDGSTVCRNPIEFWKELNVSKVRWPRILLNAIIYFKLSVLLHIFFPD